MIQDHAKGRRHCVSSQGREEVIRYKWNISASHMGFVAERMRKLRRGKLT